MCVAIPVGRGLVTWVDDEDAETVRAHKWYAVTQRRKNGPDARYVMRSFRKSGGYVTVYLHRVLTGAEAGEEVDHRDHDGLNNRRANLRKCTRAQNQFNVRSRPNAEGYRGVQSAGRKGYRASVTVAGSVTQSELFATAEEAARAYDRLAFKLHGEFAVLNFPLEEAA